MNSNSPAHLPIVKITEDHVDGYYVFANDVGKWCFVFSGLFLGFFPTREEAERGMLRCIEGS